MKTIYGSGNEIETVHLPEPHMAGRHDMGADNEFEWLNEGSIAAFTIRRNTVDAINRWVQLQLRLLATTPEGEVRRMLFDMQHVGLTNYARKRSRDVITAHPEVERQVAVILPIGAMAYVMRLHILVEVFSLVPRKRQVFTERDAAITWLLQE